MRPSVITVCFNSAATIADTLSSVAAQEGVEVEHIVVDGASTDGTMEVIRGHAWKPARVISEPDRGIYDAMNKGIAAATGEVVGFLNADDVFASPAALRSIAHAFEHPATDAVYGDLVYVRSNDLGASVRYWRSGPFRVGATAYGWAAPHPTFYVRRRLLEQHGGFDLRFRVAGDAELMIRLLERHRIRVRYLPEVLVRMRVGGVSNRSVHNVLRGNAEIIEALRKNGLPAPSLAGLLLRKVALKGRQYVQAGRAPAV